MSSLQVTWTVVFTALLAILAVECFAPRDTSKCNLPSNVNLPVTNSSIVAVNSTVQGPPVADNATLIRNARGRNSGAGQPGLPGGKAGGRGGGTGGGQGGRGGAPGLPGLPGRRL